MLSSLLGQKNTAPLDPWTFMHILSGYAIGRIFLRKHKFIQGLILMVLISYFWEIIEIQLENIHFPVDWNIFREKEHWTNRYIADPIANIAGYLMAYHRNNKNKKLA